jgi:hypothetical protein
MMTPVTLSLPVQIEANSAQVAGEVCRRSLA